MRRGVLQLGLCICQPLLRVLLLFLCAHIQGCQAAWLWLWL
jgi:hypothetical protein